MGGRLMMWLWIAFAFYAGFLVGVLLIGMLMMGRHNESEVAGPYEKDWPARALSVHSED